MLTTVDKLWLTILLIYNHILDAATFIIGAPLTSYVTKHGAHHALSEGFWQQSPSTLNSILPSPPPKEILDQIQADPYKGGFEPVSDFDEPQTPKIIYGSIPNDLVGTLAINAPGRIRIGARLLGHWFDGDGYISTLSFDGKKNKVKAYGRYVRTARFVAQELQEQRDQKRNDIDPEFKPPFAFSGAWSKRGNGNFYENIVSIPKNPSNTAIMWMHPLKESTKPRLFSLCEGGHPIELDPSTLEVLCDEQPFKSPTSTVSSFFSAHHSIDSGDGAIYNHGYILDLLASPSINLMKLSSTGVLLQQQRSDMPYNTFVHDSTISQSLLVYIVCPYITASGLELTPFVFGKKALGGLMKWRGGPFNDTDRYKSCLHVHSKKDLKLKWRIVIPHPVSVSHIADAFEEIVNDKETRLKIRVAELDFSNPMSNRPLLENQFANQYAVPRGTRLYSTMAEYTFILNNDGSGKGKFLDFRYIGDKSRDSIPSEFPVTNQVGKETRLRYTWLNTLATPSNDEGVHNLCDWFDAVQKIDMDNRDSSSNPVTFGEGVYCGPPLFIAKERLYSNCNNSHLRQFREDEGYIVVVLYMSNEHRSDVAILDSESMTVLCRMELDRHLTYSFHGDFIQDYVAL